MYIIIYPFLFQTFRMSSSMLLAYIVHLISSRSASTLIYQIHMYKYSSLNVESHSLHDPPQVPHFNIPPSVLVYHNILQSFTSSTAACNIYTPQWIIQNHFLKPNQLNSINMSKEDNDNIPNRGRSTSVTSETNSYVDHSIAASTFGPLPQNTTTSRIGQRKL